MEEDDIDVDENPDELTAIFKNKYPVAAATYKTGEEIERMEADIFIFTDDWVFRVDFSIASESAEKYAPQIEGWCNSMKLRDGGSESKKTGGAKSAEARDTEAKDAGVKGLWAELPGLPETSQTVFTAQSGGEGPAYFERTMDDGKLVVSIERVYRENNKGEERGPEDAGKLTAELELLRKEREIGEDDINVTESIDELAELYSYPVANTMYPTGEDEGARMNADFFIFTDEWIFRVHFSMALDSAEEYADKLEEWCKGLKIVDR
jgi:hypothetical protein